MPRESATRAGMERPRAEEPDDDANPRAVPCGDHAFDETLVCRCGTSWWAHQNRPRPCPDRARSRNRHATPPCADERGGADAARRR